MWRLGPVYQYYSGMLTPFPDAAESNIVLGCRHYCLLPDDSARTCCVQEKPIDNFIIACTTSHNPGALPVYGNCIYQGVASTAT